ncbi:MAG: hypothetical protein ISQ86_04210 [Alphaproteobacteria bacterium]|nr:hypothetical protein [Alphaproteobacteria bacterium]
MSELPPIPFCDLRGGTPLDLLKAHEGTALALASAAVNTFGFASRAAAAALMPAGDRASRAWLARTDNPHLDEIDAMAAQLGIRGVYFLNAIFEWGCTSGVWRAEDGPTMHRVLDWGFPDLGSHMVVALQSGGAGNFYNVTWPGLAGSFNGFAPGRFACAINQAPMRMHKRGMVGDWVKNRLAVRAGIGMPPAHLLRQVLETAPDYAAAQGMLTKTRLAVPAIFILSGVHADEGCVIERSEDAAGIRPLEGASVCVANHFESQLDRTGIGWRPRPIDSAGRVACARCLCDDEFATDFGWFKPPIANGNSRLAFNANAATGAFVLMGTAGMQPATRIFRLPMN